MRIQSTRMQTLTVGAVALLMLAWVAPATSGVIRSPTSVTSTYAEWGPIGNVIDQSGISVPWTSGADEFSAVTATHTTAYADRTTKCWMGDIGMADASLSGHIDFDLGGVYRILSLGLWGGYDDGGQRRLPSSMIMYTDENADFTTATSVGTFIVDVDYTRNTGATQVLDLTDTVGQYVRVVIDNSVGGTIPAPRDPRYPVIGEIAFETTDRGTPALMILVR